MSDKAFQEPNYTQSPNNFFDELLPQITSLAELKVTLVIMRKTFGWSKREDHLAVSQLITLTGLSRQAVLTGIELGMNRGTIERRPFKNSFFYGLSINGKSVNDLDRLEPDKSVNDLDRSPEIGQQSRPKSVNDLDPQKKRKKVNTNIDRSSPKRPMPEVFVLTPELRSIALSLDPSIDAEGQFEAFKDHHAAHASKFANWTAAWRKWIRNGRDWRAQRAKRHEPPNLNDDTPDPAVAARLTEYLRENGLIH